MPDPTGNHHHAATTTDHHGAARIIRVAATALAHCYLARGVSLSELELMRCCSADVGLGSPPGAARRARYPDRRRLPAASGAMRRGVVVAALSVPLASCVVFHRGSGPRCDGVWLALEAKLTSL